MQFWKIKSGAEAVCDAALLKLGSPLGGLPQKLLHKVGVPLRSREHLPLLARGLGLNGICVEVGVFKGGFSEQLLSNASFSQVYSIDPWTEFDSEQYLDRANVAQAEQDKRYESVQRRLKKFGDRSTILRMTSEQAAERFAAESLDFIYIDANHSYAGCLSDLQLWWPKLKAGGVIAGDDYFDGMHAGTDYGVQRAVTEFFAERNVTHSVTHQAVLAHWPNWYCQK